ncbi:MAG: restriction endonuclease subunit S [Cellulosilyticaceae bacterium]
MQKSYKKVKEFAEVVTGGTPSTKVKEYWENGNIPWLPSGECKDARITKATSFITELGLTNSAAKLMPKGTVAIALTGATTGKVGILDIEASANQSVTGILPNDHFCTEYLFYYLISQREKILFDSYGGAQKHISQGYVKDIEVFLPNKIRQIKIANVLDKAQQLIKKRKEQIEICNELIKSQFIELFGDLARNEKGWETKTINDMCQSIFGGGTPSKSKPEYYTGEIPWVTPKDMKQLVISDSIDHITEEAIKNSSAKLIPQGSVLMVIRSGILKRTLPVAINGTEVAVNQDMKAFIPNQSTNSSFLMYTFKLRENELLGNVRAVTADNIEFAIIKNLETPCPPIELQNQFAQFVQQVDKLKFAMEQRLVELENNFNSLMQRIFKGELF